MKLNKTISSVIVGFFFLSQSAADDSKVPYPEGYRSWKHLKTMIIEPGHALENPFLGIHHIYGNKKAVLEKQNGKYPDGAILVFDLLNYEAKGSTIQEAERKLVGVMHKDEKKYASTGGWGFEGFSANSKTERLTIDGGAGCYSCHVPKKESDYVYSQFRE
jgi:hypothetical protein